MIFYNPTKFELLQEARENLAILEKMADLETTPAEYRKALKNGIIEKQKEIIKDLE
jgi:hypothetical protein